MAIYRILVGSYAVEFNTASLYNENEDLLAIKNAILGAVNSVTSSKFDPESIATQLIRRHANTKVDSVYNSDKTLAKQIRVTLDNWSYQLYVLDASGKELWRGQLSYFNPAVHLKKAPNFNDYKNKVVRFTYAGGSNPNTTRVVKVTDYRSGTVYATDLVKGQPRQFKEPLISSLELVNV